MVRSTRKKGLSSRNSNDVSIDNIIASRRSKRGKENGVDGNGPKRSEREPKPSPKLKALIESAHESKEKAKNRKRRSALLPLNRRSLEVSFDENKNTVKEYTIDESMSTNCSDDGSSGSVTDKDDNASGSDTEMTTAKKKKQKRDDIRSIVGIGNNSSHNKIDNIDNDSTTVKSTSPTGATTPPTGAPSLGKNCLSPSSPNLNRQDRKAKKGDDDDDNTDRGNNKKKKGDDENDKIDRGNDRVKKKEDGKAKKGDDDDDNNDRENNQVQQKPEAEARAAAAVEQEQRELEVEAAAALQEQKEARAAALQKEKEARKAMNERKAAEALEQDNAGHDNDDDVDNEDQNKKDKKDENEDDDIGDKDKNKRKATTGKNDIVPKKRKKDFHGLEIELPKLFNETSDSVVLKTLAKIDDAISSPLKYLRNGKTISNVDVLSFPYKRTYTDELDVRVVTRDPTETLPKSKLFGGYSLIDAATQITFQEFNKSDKSWLPLPSGFFECAARYKYTKGKGIVNDQLKIISNLGDNNLLDYEVIDMVVWHDGHFSRAFIIHASKVIEGFKVEYCDVDEFIPCILYANSLDDTSWHCKKKVSAIIMKVLNEYCSEHGICRGTRLFNKKVLPIYSIQSKSNVCDIQIIFNSYTHYTHFSCRFIVPKQTDLWSCAYQTLLSRYHVMKTIKELGGGLTKNDLEDIPRDDEKDTVVFTERFKSYSASDAFIIRTDIRKVFSNLLPIERTGVNDGLSSSSTTMNEDNFFDLLGEDEDVTLVRPFKPLPKPKKEKRESATKTRTNGRSIRDENKAKEQKIREEKQSKRIGRFDGRMEKGQHKRLKTAIRRDRKVPERRVGEPAANLDTYHDAGHRKALYHFGNRTIEYDRMCDFGTAEANATMKKSTAFGVIHNPISQYPDGVGQNFMPYRLDPQRLLISTKPRNELWKIVQDLHQNFDDYVVTNDVYNLDEAVVGNNRKYDIIDLVQRKGRSTNPQDMEDNKEALDNVKVVETKKNEDSDDNHMKEKVEKQEF